MRKGEGRGDIYVCGEWEKREIKDTCVEKERQRES